MLKDELLCGEVKVPGPHQAGVQEHRDGVTLVNPATENSSAPVTSVVTNTNSLKSIAYLFLTNSTQVWVRFSIWR